MTNPVALITGGAKRLGANTATHLHGLGYTVVIHYHQSHQSALALKNTLNDIRENSAVIYQADLANHEAFTELSQWITQEFGQLNVLVNNASSFYPTPLTSLTMNQYNDLIATNMTAPLFLTQACHQLLKQTGGVVINMCDIHASRPLLNHSAYCMAKSGLQMMTQALANELAPDIRVNGIAPGAIEWPSDGINNDTVDEVLKTIPLKRKGHVEDIAKAIEYLISASYVTGHILTVDGGRQHNASIGV